MRYPDPATDELTIIDGANPPPVPLDEAILRAAEGDPFDLDLHASGFYGEETGLHGDAAHEFALTCLGNLLSMMREHAVQRRWGTDENTLLNFAFRHGHQYVEVDRARRAVVPTPAPRDVIRRTINKFEPWYTRKHGRLTSGIPAHHIRPKTRQQMDRDASRYAEELAEWRVAALYSLSHRSELSMWKLLSGTAVVYVGLEWVKDDDYMVDLADVDEETGEPRAMYRPEIVEEIVAPQAFWCDDRVPTVQAMRWAGRDLYVPLAEARASYPDADEYLSPSLVASDRGRQVVRLAQTMNTLHDPWGNTVTSEPSGDLLEDEETVLCEFWLKEGAVLSAPFLDQLDPMAVPSEVVIDGSHGCDPVVRFPEGLRVVFTPEGRVLEAGPNLYGHLPFREMRHSKSPGFWSPAPATVLREVQKALNWFASMRETHAVKVANAPLLVPREARMHRRGGLLSGLARVNYRPNRFGAKPEYLNPGNLAADYAAGEARMEAVFQDLASDHEVSQGKLPSADLSGVTVSLLQEQDLMALGYAGEEQEEAFIDLVRMELLLIQKFFPENDPRLMQLAGDAPYQLSAFMQADLEHGLDIQVVKGSSIPRSPAAVEAKAKEAWQMGFLLDKYGRPDWRTMRKIFGFGSEDELYQEEEIDIQNARSAEEMILSLDPRLVMMILASGQLPPELMPKPEDDAMVLEHEHRMRLKRLQQDPGTIHPLNVELLRMRWAACVQIVAPLLMQQDPAAVLALGAGQTPPGQAGPEGEPNPEENRAQPGAEAA